MAFSPEGRVQRALSFAIVDEVDSILIDEARTPLIISGPADDHSERYEAINGIIPKLTEAKMAEDGESFEVEGHYLLDEKKSLGRNSQSSAMNSSKLNWPTWSYWTLGIACITQPTLRFSTM